MTPLLVMGGGGHARVIIDIVRTHGGFEPIGIIDGGRSGSVDDVAVLGDDSVVEAVWEQGVRHAVVAIGSTRIRLRIAAQLESLGFTLPTLVHPSATVSNRSQLDSGVMVMAGAVVNPGSLIRSHSIVNTKSSVDHDNDIGVGVHVAPGATLCGTVTIGDRTWLGAGCTVREGVTLGSDCFVAAGAVVVADAASEVMLRGVPARPITSNP